jgi:hypothetical protein
MLLGLVSLWATERTAVAFGASSRRANLLTLVLGVPLLACWTTVLEFMHLEDALAVALIAFGTAMIAERRPWWIPTLALGLAVGCKPWAIMTWPLLLQLDSGFRLRGWVLAAVVGLVWWAPFLIVDPHAIGAVSDVRWVKPGSGLGAFGLTSHAAPSHIRLFQMLIGACLAALTVIRGRWAAAPLAAFASRALLEPAFFFYYGIGSLAAAALWDVTRPSRIPRWTIFSAVCLFVVPLWTPSIVGSIAHLGYGLTVVAFLVLPPPATSRLAINAARQNAHGRPVLAPTS